MSDLTTFAISDIIAKFAIDQKVNLEVDGIDDIAFGMVITSDKTFLDFLKQHSGIYNYVIIDGDPVRIVRRAVNAGLVIDHVIGEEECIVTKGGAAVTVSRIDITRLPRQIEVQYIDPDRNFASTTQYARHIGAPPGNSVTSVPTDFIISADQARTLAFDLLFRVWAQQTTVAFEHPDLSIEPGDTVKLITNEGTFTLLVQESTITTSRTNMISSRVLLTAKGAADGGNYLLINGGTADAFSPTSGPGAAGFRGKGTLKVDATVITGYTKWDINKSIGVTLSQDGRTATNTYVSDGNGIASDTGHINGKYYFEIVVNNPTGGYNAVGIAYWEFLLNIWLNTNGYYPFGAAAAGSIFGGITPNQSLSGEGIPTTGLANGTVICFAVDLDNSLTWARLGPFASWNNSDTADPALGIGGVTIPSGRTYYIVGIFSSSVDALGTSTENYFGDFGSNFVGVVPAGFASGWTPITNSPAQGRAKFLGGIANGTGVRCNATVIPAVSTAWVLAGVGTLVASAANPLCPNDDFANAIELFDDIPAHGNTTYATIQTGEPTASNLAYQFRSIWYKFTPASSKEYAVSLYGSQFDTELAVYKLLGGTSITNLVEVASNDDGGNDQQTFYYSGTDFWTTTCCVSYLTFAAVAGTTYYIKVDGYQDWGPVDILVTSFLARAKIYAGDRDDIFSNLTANADNFPYQIGARWTNSLGGKFSLTASAFVAATGGGKALLSSNSSSLKANALLLTPNTGAVITVHSSLKVDTVIGGSVAAVALLTGGSAVNVDATYRLGILMHPQALRGTSSLGVALHNLPNDYGNGAAGFAPYTLVNATLSDGTNTITHTSSAPGGGRFDVNHMDDYNLGWQPSGQAGAGFYFGRHGLPQPGWNFYFEVTLNLTGDQSSFGFMSAEYGSLTDMLDPIFNAVAIRKNGDVVYWYASSNQIRTQFNIGALSPGDTIAIAAKGSGGFNPGPIEYIGLFIRKLPNGVWNGGGSNNDPNYGMGGNPFQFNTVKGYPVPAVVFGGNGSGPGESVTVNTGTKPFIGSPPSVSPDNTGGGTTIFTFSPPIKVGNATYTQGYRFGIDWILGWPALPENGARLTVTSALACDGGAPQLVAGPVGPGNIFFGQSTLKADGHNLERALFAGAGSLVVHPTVPWRGGEQTFDPATASPDVTLSNGNLTATHNDTTATVGAHGYFGNGRQSGKVYFEFHVTNFVGQTSVLGIADTSSTYATRNGVMFRPYDGLAPGQFFNSVLANPAGDVICFAVDFDNAWAWIRVGRDGLWNYSPHGIGITTFSPDNTLGGINFSMRFMDFVPFVVFDGTNTQAGEQATLHLRLQDMEGVIPAGYEVWDKNYASALLPASSALTATTILIPFVPNVVQGAALFAGNGSLAADALSSGLAAYALFAGTGALSVSTSLTTTASALLSGASGLAVDVSHTDQASALFAGAGSLVLDAGVAGKVFGNALFAGNSNLTASSTERESASALFAGSGTVAVDTSHNPAGAASFSGAGSLAALAGEAFYASALFAGVGSFTSDATRTVFANFSGNSTLVAVASFQIAGSATLAGNSTFIADATHATSATSLFAGVGTITAAASATHNGAARFAGAGALSAAAGKVFTGSALFACAGALAVDGTYVSANATVPWTPAFMSNLEGWWDANDSSTITNVSGKASQINDKSTKGNNFAQATSGARPTIQTGINSLGTLKFDGAATYMDITSANGISNVSFGLSVGLVWKQPSQQGQMFLDVSANTSSNGTMQVYLSGGLIPQVAWAASAISGGTNINDAGHLTTTHVQAGYVFGGVSTIDALNSTDGTAGSVGSTALGGRTDAVSNMRLGAALGGSASNFSNSDIGEVLLWSGTSSTDRQKVEGYLAWRWSSQALLPGGHPYALAAPTVPATGNIFVNGVGAVAVDATVLPAVGWNAADAGPGFSLS